MEKRKINFKELYIIFSGLICILGGGILSMILMGRYIWLPLFGANGAPNSAGIFLVVLDVISFGIFHLTFMVMGMFLGEVLLILLLKPVLSREEIEKSVTEPYIPVISDISRKFFNFTYPQRK